MRVLVVEDNALVAMMVVEELEDAGFDVLGPANTAADAMKLVSGKGCECALVDIDLADGRTGPDIAASLVKDHGATAIFMSGQRDLALDYTDYAIGLLRKPVDPAALVETLKAVAMLRADEAPEWPSDFERFVAA
ncbi:response regulator [Acuticoccus sp. MNP-M23]|uniref:response regulator n=1 Tax=Acuticoccus sp. MNP-M23 TaxID=3072793 RepID=UPI00281569DB|nr:response regulator [Acuticoccus sp. MNP-M23]WMS43080.1 response regulator [Acuticoccus sp. MNP-M23]